MKRFKEIKDLLENVYFINEEAQLVVTFLENIGFSKPEKLVHDELGTLCGDREVMQPLTSSKSVLDVRSMIATH